MALGSYCRKLLVMAEEWMMGTGSANSDWKADFLLCSAEAKLVHETEVPYMTKKISLAGIITCLLYYLSMAVFLVAKTDLAMTIWEIMTVISGPVVLIVLIALSETVGTPPNYQKAMIAFMSCACALTGAAHIINITVTRALIREGIDVPSYFQIGRWPSVEMAADYLAWGFFTGLAFLCVSLPYTSTERSKQILKLTSLICSALCITGFIGGTFINEYLWYFAPAGYGNGLLLLCIMMFKGSK